MLLKPNLDIFPDAIGYYALKDAPLRACSSKWDTAGIDSFNFSEDSISILELRGYLGRGILSGSGPIFTVSSISRPIYASILNLIKVN